MERKTISNMEIRGMNGNQNIKGVKVAVIVFFRLLLGLVFIYASFEKIMDPVTFSLTIDLYKATPISINNLVALIIPWKLSTSVLLNLMPELTSAGFIQRFTFNPVCKPTPSS